MKLKKLLALLLAVVMVFALAACGSSNTSDTTDTSDASPVDEGSEEAGGEEAEPADEGGETSDLPFDVNNLGDPVVLTVTCGFSDTEDASQLLQYCMDMIEDLSGGNITFDAYMGGSASTPLEDGPNIQSGASDFGVMLETILAEQLVSWQYFGYGSTLQECMDNANYILFENEETSAILQKEAEDANLKVLAGNITGATGLCFREEILSYAEMAGLIYGTEIGGDTFRAFGLSVYTCPVSDEYENLSRGVVDCTGAGVSAVYANKWYEVAPYVLITEESHVSYWFSVNLDTWNSLTADQQALIDYACKETSAYSIEFSNQYTDDAIVQMEENGATVNWFSKEDEEYSTELKHVMNYNSFIGLAQAQGVEEEFQTVVDATLDWFGYDFDELSEKYATEIARAAS